MKFIDQFGNENSIPETEFENGRQNALDKIEWTINFRNKGLEAIKNEVENMKVPREIRDIIQETYLEILKVIKDERHRNAEIQYYANSQPKNQK
jgi:hypothetical protein